MGENHKESSLLDTSFVVESATRNFSNCANCESEMSFGNILEHTAIYQIVERGDDKGGSRESRRASITR